jgi:hypothetical protein
MCACRDNAPGLRLEMQLELGCRQRLAVCTDWHFARSLDRSGECKTTSPAGFRHQQVFENIICIYGAARLVCE